VAGMDGDKTALVLGMAATVLGWQTSRITEDVRSTLSVAYWVESRIDTAGAPHQMVIIENVSKDKLLANVKFEIMCQDGKECIKRDSFRIKVYPPTANQTEVLQVPANTDENGEVIAGMESLPVTSLPFQTTLAAGGKVGIEYDQIKGSSAPDFIFAPDPKTPLDIYVFGGNTVRGFVVRHYFEIMFLSFVATVMTLLVALAVMFARQRKHARPIAEAQPERPRRKPATKVAESPDLR
jgi:hypothetical protein